MFREILGLPAHALIVHGAVVFVPLLAVAGIAYGVLPRFRDKLAWAAALLAVAAPVVTWVAQESGEELRAVLIEKQYPAQILQQVHEHEEYAETLFNVTLALAAAIVLLLLVTSRHPRARALPSWVGLVLTAVVVVLAFVASGYVYVTGHSGAEAVWTGVL